MLFSLRIFFERANKTTNVVSWLGNVYRNSKWSSLSLQNIKLSFRLQMFVLYTFFFLVILLNYFLFHNFNALAYFLGKPANLWYIIQDGLSYTSLLLLSCIYVFIQKLDLLFSNFVPNFFLSVGNNELDKKLNNVVLRKSHKLVLDNTNQFQKVDLNDKGMLLLALNLKKASYYLSLVNFQYSNVFFKPHKDFSKLDNIMITTLNEFWLKFYFLTLNTYKLDIASNLTRISKNEDFYKLQSNKFNYVSYSSLYMDSLFRLNFKPYQTSILNLYKNLNLSKQNRWLWKTSLLSDKNTMDFNKITHIKKLVDNNNSNVFALKANIWSSNKLVSNSNFLKLSQSLADFEMNDLPTSFNLGSKTSSSSLNNYESSLFWVVKRFSFTQLMFHNIQTISNSRVSYQSTKELVSVQNMWHLFQLKLYYNYKFITGNLSFYPNLVHYNSLNIWPNDINFSSYNLLASQELFTIEDVNFLKFMLSNTFIQKNKVSFFSFL